MCVCCIFIFINPLLSQLTISYHRNHLSQILITWHLSSCFISGDGLFPLSDPTTQRENASRLTGYCLLTNAVSLSLSMQSPMFFFFKHCQSLGKISTKWGTIVDIHTVGSRLLEFPCRLQKTKQNKTHTCIPIHSPFCFCMMAVDRK